MSYKPNRAGQDWASRNIRESTDTVELAQTLHASVLGVGLGQSLLSLCKAWILFIFLKTHSLELWNWVQILELKDFGELHDHILTHATTQMTLEDITPSEISHKRTNTPQFHSHMALRTVKFIGTESRMVGGRGWEGWCLRGGVSVVQDEEVLEVHRCLPTVWYAQCHWTVHQRRQVCFPMSDKVRERKKSDSILHALITFPWSPSDQIEKA